MNGIAVIGDGETVLPYKAFGFATFASEAKDSGSIIRELISCDEYSVIFITEEHAEAQGDVLRELKVSERTFPIVIEIPGISGSRGHGRDRIKRIVERAVGADILSKEE